MANYESADVMPWCSALTRGLIGGVDDLNDVKPLKQKAPDFSQGLFLFFAVLAS
jgi:hypothetical protein